MEQPLQIIFHGMEASAAIEDAARAKAAHLDHFASDIMRCRVVVDLLHKHRHQGRPFCVRIDLTRQRRGDEKQHPRELHGEVVRLNGPEGFGFIRTPDGEEYYFDNNNLTSGRFDQLEAGTAVQFITEPAAQGQQAKRVSLGKHKVGG